MYTCKFSSFGRIQSGRVITHSAKASLCVVRARNPYGKHNLVLVSTDTGNAIRHGNVAVLQACAAWMPDKQYRKVARIVR